MALKAILEPLETLSTGTSSSSARRRSSNINTERPRTLTMNDGACLTLNQTSTGVPLFHEINLSWGQQGTDTRLMLTNPPCKARVTVNDKQTCYGCRLRDGDILSFMSMEGILYKYKIRIITETAAHHETAAAAAAAVGTVVSRSPKTRSPRKRAAATTSSVYDSATTGVAPSQPSTVTSTPTAASHDCFAAAAEEFSCVVCMEIQVQSTTLVPCGHSLCKACVDKSTACPTCRAPVKQQVPNLLIDNAVDALTRCDGFFKPDDVTFYLSRTGRNKDKKNGAATAATSSTSSISVAAATLSTRAKRQRRQQQQQQGLGSTVDEAICID